MSSSLPKADSAYRNCVGIMLLNSENKIFIAKRIDVSNNAWQMPQGGIEGDELPLDAALRELKEEIGTNNVALIAQLDEWLTYNFPESLGARLWGGQYKGQRQKWFALRFLGKDEDINLDTAVPEFTHWRWADVNEVLDDVIDFKRETYYTLIENLFPKTKAP